MTDRHQSSERFVALDSLRGLCALAVCLFHFPVESALSQFSFIKNSYLFVDFFFVLSGFVIVSVYRDRLTDMESARRFVVRRFGRLWPLHISILAVFVLASTIKGELGSDDRHSISAVFTNLLLIHGLGVHDSLTWNDPSWSISVEAMLYLSFVLLALLWRRPAPIYVALVVGSILILIFRAPNGMASTFDFGALRGVAGFFTGALIAHLPARRAYGGAEFAASVLAAAFVTMGQLTFLAPAVFGLCVYVFAGSTGPISRALNNIVAVKLGEWSYSIYMVHAAVIAVIWTVSDRLRLSPRGADLVPLGQVHGLILAVAYLAIVVAISAVTFTMIEDPARKAFNRLASRRAQMVPAE